MRRKLMKSLLGSTLTGILLLAGPAHAGMTEGAQSSMKQGLSDFNALLKEATDKTSPPRLGDAKAGPILENLLDRQKVLGAHPYKSGEIEPLLAAFGTYFSLSKAYLGYKGPDGNNVADNELQFQDELTRLAIAMVESGGAISEALTDYVNTTPAASISEDRKMGLAKLRLGVGQMFTGAIGILQDPRYSEENKQRLAASLAEEAPYLSAILRVEDRKGLSQTAMAAMASMPRSAQAPINQFMAEMASEECTGLCALK